MKITGMWGVDELPDVTVNKLIQSATDGEDYERGWLEEIGVASENTRDVLAERVNQLHKAGVLNTGAVKAIYEAGDSIEYEVHDGEAK